MNLISSESSGFINNYYQILFYFNRPTVPQRLRFKRSVQQIYRVTDLTSTFQVILHSRVCSINTNLTQGIRCYFNLVRLILLSFTLQEAFIRNNSSQSMLMLSAEQASSRGSHHQQLVYLGVSFF